MQSLCRVFLAASLAVPFTAGGSLVAKSPAKTALSSVPTEDLITQLQGMPEECFDTDIMVSVTGFLGINLPVRIGTGILFDPAESVMRELVRRGTEAVPFLLNHLSDARPTKMRMGRSNISRSYMFCCVTEDVLGDFELINLPSGVAGIADPLGDIQISEDYHLLLGDLCYEALGQIVNRLLSSVLNDFDDFLVIISPVHSPTLTAAVRARWSGLTRDRHRQSLVDDVQSASDDIEALLEGLQRLMFYYPNEGRKLVVQLLKRPTFDEILQHPFAPKDLYDSDDEKEQNQILERCRQENGEKIYWLVVQGIILTANQTFDARGDSEEVEEIRRRLMNAKAIVAKRFNEMNKHPRAVDIASFCDDQRKIVEAVADIPSREIDRAARDLLKRVLKLRPVAPHDKRRQYWLSSACMQRLAPSSAMRRDIEKEADHLDDVSLYDGIDARSVRAYFRRCDRYLRKWSRRVLAGAQPSARKSRL